MFFINILHFYSQAHSHSHSGFHPRSHFLSHSYSHSHPHFHSHSTLALALAFTLTPDFISIGLRSVGIISTAFPRDHDFRDALNARSSWIPPQNSGVPIWVGRLANFLFSVRVFVCMCLRVC